MKFIVYQSHLNKPRSGLCAWAPECAGRASTSQAHGTLGENHALPSVITFTALFHHVLLQWLEVEVPDYSYTRMAVTTEWTYRFLRHAARIRRESRSSPHLLARPQGRGALAGHTHSCVLYRPLMVSSLEKTWLLPPLMGENTLSSSSE